MAKTYTIDGCRFETLEGFYQEVSQSIFPEFGWGHNLDALNDVLRGGFGTPEEGFVVIWKDSSVSKSKLGYEETIRVLKKKLETCHPSNTEGVRIQLERAHLNQGSTVFDWLVNIFLIHGEGGLEAEDNVKLILD